MPKIHGLPPLTDPLDATDVFPIDDASVADPTSPDKTKRVTFTQLKEWLQSLAGWITTAMIGDGQVTPNKMSIGAQGSYGNNTTRTYTSTTFVNVSGRSVTVTVPASGKVRLNLGAYVSGPSSAAIGMFFCVDLTGANVFNTDTSPPADDRYMRAGTMPNPSFYPFNASKVLSGLTPGVTTFQLQARLAGGSGSCAANNEYITVTPV